MSSLLLCTYFVVGMIILGFLEESGRISATNFHFSDIALSFVIMAVPAVVFLGMIMLVLAISDAAANLQVVDGRYFTRCLVYRLLFAIVVFAYGINQYLWAIKTKIDPALMQEINSGPNDLFNFIGFIGVVSLALVLNGAVSFHVISGLISSRKNKSLSENDVGIHIVFQLFLGFDIVGSAILAVKEARIYPKERLAWIKNLISRNAWPIPGFFGASLGIAAIGTLNSRNASIGLLDYLLDNQFDNLPHTDNPNLLSSEFFYFSLSSLYGPFLTSLDITGSRRMVR